MNKIIIIVVLLLLCLGVPYGFGAEITDDVYLPEFVFKCFENPKVAGLEILSSKNPFYLRGDFDGNKKPDYAVQVKAKSGGNGICICAGDGSIYLLGSGITGGEKFSDMEKDNFLALNWTVSTKQEIDELAKWKCNVPDPFPKIENESIQLIWYEGGSDIIYWDGKKYKWTEGFTSEPREGCTIK